MHHVPERSLLELPLSHLLHQPLHEVNQDVRIHGALIDFEAHLASIGDAGD